MGLPLLMEFRSFTTSSAIGLNVFDVNMVCDVDQSECSARLGTPVNSRSPSATLTRPNFRNFSDGGIDTAGNPESRNPDSQLTPAGGFESDPMIPPLGAATTGSDPVQYIGGIDYVTKISRVHTIWLDTGLTAADFEDPVVQFPELPAGTDLIIEYRGATGFTASIGDEPFDAETLDPYGDPVSGVDSVDFVTGQNEWVDDIDLLDGAVYVQVRITFISNVETSLFPEISAFGIAFEEM